ncbi:hypothetical protein BDN72DRAFT_806701 [Pluteus cervinus]|uniref:Uncharacterized protein n=1 Tax=Pluteus cervinus TaxID=181527 RepID=A0ACD3BGC7_9AGAR|nr:hypothetical protein BDN72DRAFT_806701 [Pluteus cervinus]
MSQKKGKTPQKQPNGNGSILHIPATGSANPAASLPALWAYIQPALDHIIKSPSNDPYGKAPSIDVGFYSGIHSACYNYFTSPKFQPKPEVAGIDIYGQLDKYFSETARELMLGTPQDDTTLIHYIIPCFNRYSSGVQSVNRLLSYVNRHYVSRAIDEDKGWLRISDILQSVAKTISPDDTREKISERLRQKRVDELKKWGYDEGGVGATMAVAETCAEAASPEDRIVPISSLAMRRFRIDFIEPLLAVPKMNGKAKSKAKHKIPKDPVTPLPPKGRLARAVKVLVESQTISHDDRNQLIRELAKMLQMTGVRPEHVLRKRLDKLVATQDAT